MRERAHTAGSFLARALTWQNGLSKTPVERNRMKAALSSTPFFMPSFVRSSARLSYQARKPMSDSSRYMAVARGEISERSDVASVRTRTICLIAARALAMAGAGEESAKQHAEKEQQSTAQHGRAEQSGAEQCGAEHSRAQERGSERKQTHTTVVCYSPNEKVVRCAVWQRQPP